MSTLSKGKDWIKRVGNAVRRAQPAKHEGSEKGAKLKDKASKQLKSGGRVTGGTDLNKGGKVAGGSVIKASGPVQAAGGKLNVAGKK